MLHVLEAAGRGIGLHRFHFSCGTQLRPIIACQGLHMSKRPRSKGLLTLTIGA